MQKMFFVIATSLLISNLYGNSKKVKEYTDYYKTITKKKDKNRVDNLIIGYYSQCFIAHGVLDSNIEETLMINCFIKSDKLIRKYK